MALRLLLCLAGLIALASAVGDTFGFGTGFGVNLADPNNPVISSGLNIPLGPKGTVHTGAGLQAGTHGFNTGIGGGLVQNDEPNPPEKKVEKVDLPEDKKPEKLEDESKSEEEETSTLLYTSTVLPKKTRRNEVIFELTPSTVDPVAKTTQLLDILEKASTTFRPPKIGEHRIHDTPAVKLHDAEDKKFWVSSTIAWPITSSIIPEDIDDSSSEEDHTTIIYPDKV